MLDNESICGSCNWPITFKEGKWLTPDQQSGELPRCGGIEGVQHIAKTTSWLTQ